VADVTTTANMTRSQIGVSTGLGNWTDSTSAGTMLLSVGQRIGFTFDFGVTLDTSLTPARALDPPILVSAGAIGAFSINAGFTTVFSFSQIADPTFVGFSAAVTPFDFSLTALSTGNSVAILAPVSLTLTSAQLLSLRSLVTGRAWWTGVVGFVIEATSGGPGILDLSTPLTWASVETQMFFSGLIGGPTGGHVRVVRDGRFAVPALSTELVRDGDQPSLWVRSSDQDPEDPSQEYRPRPGEGTVDDEIPNL
jgi:hypothetical protein